MTTYWLVREETPNGVGSFYVGSFASSSGAIAYLNKTTTGGKLIPLSCGDFKWETPNGTTVFIIQEWDIIPDEEI